ncbi:DUF667 domain-containing protein, partial [Haematococcus lacustris]
ELVSGFLPQPGARLASLQSQLAERRHVQELFSKVRNGHIKRITDQDIQSSVLEICGDNVANVFITAPADPTKTLGIKLPFLVMIIKNLKKYFSFEVQVLDDKNVRRRFRASNYQTACTVKRSCLQSSSCFFPFRSEATHIQCCVVNSPADGTQHLTYQARHALAPGACL